MHLHASLPFFLSRSNCRKFGSGSLEKKKKKEGGKNEKKGEGMDRERVFAISAGDDEALEVKSGQAEAFDSPTESTGLRTVPTDKPPPPPPWLARIRRGYTSQRLRRVNRNAGHEATDARENGRIARLLPSTLLSLHGIHHHPSTDLIGFSFAEEQVFFFSDWKFFVFGSKHRSRTWYFDLRLLVLYQCDI